MGYTITVWLSFVVFLTLVGASLPKSSETVPVISVYIILQIAVGTITVLTSAIASRIESRSDDQPVCSYLKRIALMLRRTSIELDDDSEKLKFNITLKDGITAFDRLLF